MRSLALAPFRSTLYGALCAWLLISSIGITAAQPPPAPGGQPGPSQGFSDQPPLQVAAAYASANKLYANKQYAEALAGYQNFVKLASDAKLNSNVILAGYSHMAVIYHILGDNKNYADALRKMVNLDPQNAPAFAQLALTESIEHNYADAEVYANKTLALKPAAAIESTAHFVKGNVAISHKDFAGAVKEFGTAATLLPTNAMAHFNCGLALAELKQYPRALKELQTAHKLAPKDAHINEDYVKLSAFLASSKTQSQSPQSAQSAQATPSTEFDAILKKDPHNGPALLGRARQLAKMGRTADAESAYNAAIAGLPDSYEAHFNLAYLYLKDTKQPNFDNAKFHYKAAQQIAEKAANPVNNANALGGLADAEMQEAVVMGDYRTRGPALATAESHIKQAIALEPKQDQFKSLLGKIYEAQSRFKDAANTYHEMIAASPDSVPLYARLANTYKAVHDIPGYVKAWKEYQVRKPDDPTSYEYIAEMYNQVGDYQGGVDALREMLKRNLSNSVIATAMVVLGQDLIKLKHPEEAIALFKKVLAMTPSKVSVLYMLGEKAALDMAKMGALRGLAREATEEKELDTAIAYLNDLKTREAEMYKASNQPPDGQIYKDIGTLYEQGKNTDKAIAEYKDMAKALPTSPAAHEEMGRVLESLKKIEAAAAEYRIAAKLNTKDPVPDALKVSEMYQRNDMQDKALTELEALRKAHPTKVEVLTALALIYRRTKQDEKALEIYNAIIKTNPNQGWVQDARAQCMINLHQYADAEKVYIEEINRNPKAGRQTYADLARIFGQEGKAGKFLDFMKPRFEKDPTISTVMAVVYDEFVSQNKEPEGQAYIVGVIDKATVAHRPCFQAYATQLQLHKHNSESLDIYRRIAKENSKDISAWLGLADELDYNGLHDDANQIYLDQIARTDIQPSDVSNLRYKLATRYFQQNKLQDARAAFQTIFDKNNRNFDAAMRLGDLIEKTGTADEAITFYNRLLGIQFSYLQVRVDIRDRLGNLYEKVNKPADAIIQFQETLKLDKDDAIANAQLKKLQANPSSAPAQ